MELPWGFLFQQGRPNEGIASGFCAYGLSRVASATREVYEAALGEPDLAG